ncbi:MAG: cytochrome c3 family protein [Phycisphaerales bacterium]
MPETRAISERINLAYVKRKHWPQNAMFRLSFLFAGVVVLGALALEGGQTTGSFAGHVFYNSGHVTQAHSMFGNNCAACHVADTVNPQKIAFNLPVRDEKCLDCHETHAAAHHPDLERFNGPDRLVKGYAEPIKMSGSCASCHVEHQGRDFDLTRVSDGVCTQCHESIQAKGYASGKAPAQARIMDVSSFSSPGGHPNWELFRTKAKDVADYAFGHEKHYGVDGYAVMQGMLKDIQEGKSPAPAPTGRASHIEMREGKLAMSCTFCHEVDSAGMYMKPVRFEVHCADCHTSALGVVGAQATDEPADVFQVISDLLGSEGAGALTGAHAMPHGSSREVAEIVQKAIAQFVATNPPQFAALAAEPEAPKEEESGGRRRRGGGGGEAAPAEQPADDGGGGRRRRGGGDEPAAAPPAATIPKSISDRDKLQAWMAQARKDVMEKLAGGSYCGKCHMNLKPGPAEAPELFAISDQRIPDRWLPKSIFGHVAHAAIKCVECHAAAKSSLTTDILLPNVDNCRQCHAQHATPSGSSAPFDCTLCHSFHRMLPGTIEGTKTIDQVREGGISRLIGAPAAPVGGKGEAAASSAPP